MRPFVLTPPLTPGNPCPFPLRPPGVQVTALLLTGQRPDAPPRLGPGASETSSEATYLSLLCDQEDQKKRKGREDGGNGMTATTHTVPPSHIAGLLQQEIERQKKLVRTFTFYSTSDMFSTPIYILTSFPFSFSPNSMILPPALPPFFRSHRTQPVSSLSRPPSPTPNRPTNTALKTWRDARRRRYIIRR